MVALVRPQGGEVQPEPIPGGYQFPDLTLLPTGNFVALWSGFGNAEDANGSGVKGQLLEQDGNRIGSDFFVNTTTTGNQSGPAAAVLASGDFVVTWSEFPGKEYAQIFKSDGTKLGGEIAVTTEFAATGVTGPDVAGLTGGGFVTVGSRNGDISAKLFDANGASVRAIVLDTGGFDIAPVVTALSDGGFVVLWGSQDGGPQNLMGQIFDLNGDARGGMFQVNTSAGGGFIDAAAIGFGGFVAAWAVFGENGGIKAQHFDPFGNKVGEEIAVSGLTPNYQTNPTVITYPWGGFVIAWEDDSPGQQISGPSLRAQLFDADGTKLGDEFKLNVQDHWERYPQLTAVSETEFVVHWVDDGDVHGGGTSGLTQRSFELPRIGTTKADTLTGTASVDAIAGRAGDDMIQGNEGDDALDGGAGTDTLQGNAGNDALDGGPGDDTLTGGAGDDDYYVDSGMDVVIESSGGGLDRVFAAADYTLSANVETLTLTGAALAGTGNADKNTIIGNDLDNVINGGIGADSMAGGKGDDTYYVDVAGDVVTEANDQGIDTIISAITLTLPDDVEGLTLSGTLAIDGTGNWWNNQITGNAADNELRGEGANDTLAGGGGDDLLYGGDGVDIAVFSGARAGHTVAEGEGGELLVASDGEGEDVLDGIEVLSFADGAYAWDAVTGDVRPLHGEAGGFRLFTPDRFEGRIAGVGQVFGTQEVQDVTLLGLPGTIHFDPSFNRGGDHIRFEGFADEWEIARIGSSAQLFNGFTTVTIPVGTEGTALHFFDGLRLLRYDQDSASIKIGEQTLSASAETILALAESFPPGLPTNPELAGRLFLPDGGGVTLRGTFSAFGTAGEEHLTLLEGKLVLDPSFNRGGDTLSLAAFAQQFTAARVGSSVELSTSGYEILIPVGEQGMTLDFGDGPRELFFDPEAAGIFIDSQLITTTPTALGDFG